MLLSGQRSHKLRKQFIPKKAAGAIEYSSSLGEIPGTRNSRAQSEFSYSIEKLSDSFPNKTTNSERYENSFLSITKYLSNETINLD
jgi:hypothetical protein